MIKGIIYKYTSPSGKCYIGQTTNENKRQYEHRYNAFDTNCKNYNNKFYTAIRKYGWDSFQYEVLYTIIKETSEEIIETLNEREIYYIGLFDSYKNGYNMTIGGRQLRGIYHPSYGTHLSEEHKNKLVQSVSKQVSQYDINGNYIATYDSATNAQLATGCDASQIIAICKGKAYTSKNYQWRYGNSKENIGVPNIPKSKGGTGRYGKLNGKSKQVFQYTLQGELVNIWESALQAEREQKYSSTHISKAVKLKKPYGKRDQLKYIWSFIQISDSDVRNMVKRWNNSIVRNRNKSKRRIKL